jgi:hypothetical protein
MSCAAHRSRNRGRVLCFECYRARIDHPERVKLVATPFPRVLTARELEHRRRMLAQLSRAKLSAEATAQSGLRGAIS